VAHPVNLNLFDLLSLANSASGGTLLGTGLLIGAVAFFAFGVALHERKTRKAERRARNVQARAEQEHLAGATVRELHLDERDVHPPTQLERVLRAALTEEAGRQTLNGRQPAAYRDDVHDVFEEDGRD
jgi:hypothetical protein